MKWDPVLKNGGIILFVLAISVVARFVSAKLSGLIYTSGYFAAFILSLIAIRRIPKSDSRILYWLYSLLALFLGLDEISFGREYGDWGGLKQFGFRCKDVHNCLQYEMKDILRTLPDLPDLSLVEEMLLPFLKFNLGLIVLSFVLIIGLRKFYKKASQINFTFLILLSGGISFWALIILAALSADPKNTFIFSYSFQLLLPMPVLLGLGLMAFGFALVNNFRKRGKDVEGWINISVFQDHFHWLTKATKGKRPQSGIDSKNKYDRRPEVVRSSCLEQPLESSIAEEDANDRAELRLGKGYFFLSTIAALISVLWLILLPSDPKNALLFGYSITRLAMIVVGASTLLLFIRGLQKSLNDRDWYSTLSIGLHNVFNVKMRRCFSLILALVGLYAGITFMIALLTGTDSYIQGILARMAPWVFLALVLFAQLLYYVLRNRMNEVMKDIAEWLYRWWRWIPMVVLAGLATGLLLQFLLIVNVHEDDLGRNALFATMLHWWMLQLALLMSAIILQPPNGNYGVIEIPLNLLYRFANTPPALFVITTLVLLGIAQWLDTFTPVVDSFEVFNRQFWWPSVTEEAFEGAGGILMAIGTFYFPKGK